MVVTKVVKEESGKQWAEAKASASASSSQSESAQSTRRVTRKFRRDGTLASETRQETEVASRSQAQAAASSSASATGAEQSRREERVKAVTAPDLVWSLSVGAYQDARATLRREFQPSVGVTLTRRLIGPLAATAWAWVPVKEPSQAQGGVGLVVTFRL